MGRKRGADRAREMGVATYADQKACTGKNEVSEEGALAKIVATTMRARMIARRLPLANN